MVNVNACVTINGVARFLFVVVPVVCHLWPAAAIGDALAAKGHDVAWCEPESDLRPLVGPGQVMLRPLHVDLTILAKLASALLAIRA